MNTRELLAERADKLDEAKKLNDLVEAEAREFTEAEQAEYDGYMAEVEKYDQRIERSKKLEEMSARFENGEPVKPQRAPAHIRKPGDNFQNALFSYIRTGDRGGIRHLINDQDEVEIRASNDTTMNITTAADGGVGVPTTLFESVIAKRDEMDLTSQLACRRFSGPGTSKDIVYDNEDDGEFVSTNESSAFDRDAPALAKLTLTKVKYTKKTDITYELNEDNDVNLFAFLTDFFGRGMAKTRNNLLITEVGTNGTALKTFAGESSIAAGEPEDIVGNDALSNYLDDSQSCAWVMRSATHWDIMSITGNPRLYASPDEGRMLLGWPVKYSAKVSAQGSGNKSVYFGNWYYVAYFEEPSFTMLRDPYSRARYGEIILHMYFRIDYGTLQAEAIGYGAHATS